MSVRRPNRPITLAQILGLFAFALGLFFMFSFATKSVDAYRLRNWRDRAQGELQVLERERQELLNEVAYRQSPGWEEEALRNAGLLPTDAVRVVVTTREASALATAPAVAAPMSATVELAAPVVGPPAPEVWFDNGNWRAWRELILGFDAPAEGGYNPSR